MTLLLQNSLRLAVRSDGAKPEGVILSFAGVVNTQRYERRRAELAFVEDGVRVAAGQGVERRANSTAGHRSVTSWRTPTIRTRSRMPAPTAPAVGVSRPQTGVLENLRWVPTEDIHLPLHACSKRSPNESPELRTVQEQQTEQREFDERVGHVTVGADRGEA